MEYSTSVICKWWQFPVKLTKWLTTITSLWMRTQRSSFSSWFRPGILRGCLVTTILSIISLLRQLSISILSLFPCSPAPEWMWSQAPKDLWNCSAKLLGNPQSSLRYFLRLVPSGLSGTKMAKITSRRKLSPWPSRKLSRTSTQVTSYALRSSMF